MEQIKKSLPQIINNVPNLKITGISLSCICIKIKGSKQSVWIRLAKSNSSKLKKITLLIV